MMAVLAIFPQFLRHALRVAADIGMATIQELVNSQREEARAQREVTVPAEVLSRVVTLAGEFLRRTDIESGAGAAARLYPAMPEAVQQIRKALED